MDKLNTKLKVLIFYLLTIAILMISSYLGNHIDGLKLINGRVDDLAYGHPFVRCWYLLLGMIVGKCYQRKQQVNGCYVFTTTLLAVIWFLNRNTFINIGRALRDIDVMVCTLVLYIFSIGSGKIIEFLSKDKMVWLGEISECLFLLHYPIRMIVGTLFEKYNLFGLNTGIAGLLQVFIIVSLTIIITRLWKKYEPLFLKVRTNQQNVLQ